MESIDIDWKKITFLQENNFCFTEEQKQVFFDTVILYLCWGDEDMLESFISYEETETSEQKCNAKLHPVEFKDFERKIREIAREKDIWVTIKLVKTGGKNFYFPDWNIINIGTTCTTKKHRVHQMQQQKAIKYLHCTRTEWINT